MKATHITYASALLFAIAFVSGCSNSEPNPKTAKDLKAFQSTDLSKAPPDVRLKIENGRRSVGAPPATSPAR